MSDLISRADAICEVLVNDGIENIVDRINALPSAEAESDDLIIKGAKGIQDGLYNIKDGELFKYKAKGGTVRVYSIVPSAEAEWIPLKTRPMDEEERREWSEKFGYDIEYDEAVIYVSQLPDDGQAVLTCNRYGNITIDTFENDPDYGCSFEESGDMDGILAWMPLPKPYREDGEA